MGIVIAASQTVAISALLRDTGSHVGLHDGAPGNSMLQSRATSCQVEDGIAVFRTQAMAHYDRQVSIGHSQVQLGYTWLPSCCGAVIDSEEVAKSTFCRGRTAKDIVASKNPSYAPNANDVLMRPAPRGYTAYAQGQ